MTTQESEVVLSPCPFCGSRDVRVAGVSGAYVMCTPCGAEGPYGDFTDEQAIAAWNNRPALTQGA